MRARVTLTLDERLADLMERAHVPGLSAVVVEDGQITWSGVFGVRHRDSAERVESDTVYQAASLSKPVFAFAVMQLVRRGTIGLDTPLSAYLPEPYVEDDAMLARVTARHVLSHVTGWPNWRPNGQALRRAASPGERFGYSGEGYVYLQRVVEHVSGRSLEELMQTDVLAPLGMAHSTFAWMRADDPGVAGAHDRDGAPIAPYRGEHANAASSLHSTPTDFAAFMMEFLTPSRGIQDEMLRTQVRVNGNVAWGLGWGLQVSDQGEAFWHWGDNPGYKSLALALRQRRKGVVVMTNGDGGRPLCAWIVQSALGADHPSLGWLERFYQDLDAAEHPAN